MTQPGRFTIDDREAREAAAYLQASGSKVNAAVIAGTQGPLSAAFVEEIGKSAGTAQQKRIIGTGARAFGTGFGLTMQASATAKLSGGLVAADDGRAFEFGKSVERELTYSTHSRKGTRYTVTRVTTAQLPGRSRSGWVAYPAGGRTFDRMLQWVLQVLVKFSHDAIERNG